MMKYSIHIMWSAEDEGYIATIPEFSSLSAFGKTQEEALNEAKKVLDDYIEIFKEDGVQLPQTNQLTQYSGQIRLRMPKELHRNISLEADRQGVSLNTYMIYLLAMNYPMDRLDRLEKECFQAGVRYSTTGPVADDYPAYKPSRIPIQSFSADESEAPENKFFFLGSIQ